MPADGAAPSAGIASPSHFHPHPEQYEDVTRQRVPGYDAFQRAIAEAARVAPGRLVLDLGTGTGATAAAVLDLVPDAMVIGIDRSITMLVQARAARPQALLVLADLADLPATGPVDVVICALASHHLDGPGRASLVRRVEGILRPGGRFVLGDVIDPDDPDDRVTAIGEVFDPPRPLGRQLAWLEAAGLRSRVAWRRRDLAVLTGDKPAA